ncbi:very-long-chain aldehyde decarbonylase CER1-like [Tasmannia lanceolata]|uniref:very-long-chain aldehyde decarbonylase CER1-like n=1 Tax=Tasmannia lanceolata TaxID=3420 RepID=UPI004062A90C
MASKPGIFTEWPWQKLGSFKYVVLIPWVAESLYSYTTKGEGERDLSNVLIFPFLLWRFLHNQIWISLSRFQTARSKHTIVHKGIEFEQVDREGNWDDQILLNGTFLYLSSKFLLGASHLPFWRIDGLIITILLHAGPVEFLYYWLHRALHHHYLYNRYHSHHHSSIVTEPITSVIHPFVENLTYFVLFTIPLMTLSLSGTLSIVALAGYETYIDFMNNLGHCNFEIVPNRLFQIFPPLKYIMYTPSMQTWAIPRNSFQYSLSWQRAAINSLIEKAILEAEAGGVKVISLGLLNQGEELNRNGEHYLQKHPKLKLRIVDGTALAVAVVLYSIPLGTKQVLLRGKLSKTGYAVALALCHKGIQVITVRRDEFEKLKLLFPAKMGSHLVLCSSYNTEIWLVGDGLTEEEQRRAPKGTRFIPFSQFPPKKVRRDCVYYTTPALKIPKALENIHSCENWLPRRVMSAWRVGGIIHALEGWDAHECGDKMLDIEEVWNAALQHGFLPVAHV